MISREWKDKNLGREFEILKDFAEKMAFEIQRPKISEGESPLEDLGEEFSRQIAQPVQRPWGKHLPHTAYLENSNVAFFFFPLWEGGQGR